MGAMTKINVRTRRILLLVVLALAVALAPAAADDLKIVSKVVPEKGKPTTSTQYITKTKVLTSDGRYDTVFDVKTGSMVHIDHKKKEYYESSLEEMRAALEEVNKMLESNPMLERMLGQAAEVEVRKGSDTGNYAGYDCQQYFMRLGNKMEFELCTAPDLEMPIEYYDARKMVYAAMGPMASRFEQMFDEMKKIDGYAVMTRIDTTVMGMNASSVTEAIEVVKGPIDPDVFDPPAGYKKKKSPYQNR